VNGEFGSFYVTLQSEGADTEDDFFIGNIRKYSVHFRPGKLFKNVLNKASYESTAVLRSGKNGLWIQAVRKYIESPKMRSVIALGAAPGYNRHSLHKP